MGDFAHALQTNPLAASLVARCNFPSTPTVAAVSGGPDSMALMCLAHLAGCLLHVVHVDHGLREDSDKDADLINDVAEQLGIEVQTVKVDLSHGPNLEARAREARYAALPKQVMTGHTMDDQAETVIINLLRGSGTSGLAAMNPDTNHPMLNLRRDETRAMCTQLGIKTVDDHMNSDPRYQRNRIRSEIIPLLNDVSHRDIVPVLARQADILRDDDKLLSELAAALNPTDARALASADPAVARRAVRAWLANPYPPDSATVERVMEVARGETIGTDIGGGRHISRHKQVLRISHIESTKAHD